MISSLKDIVSKSQDIEVTRSKSIPATIRKHVDQNDSLPFLQF